jgi:hypothetical protein
MDLVEKTVFLLILLFSTLAHAHPGRPKIQFTFSYSGPLHTPEAPAGPSLHNLPHRNADLATLYSLMRLPPEARAQRLATLCSPLSFERKMELGTSLGFLLSGIYDDSRTGNGPNSNVRVTIEDQWNALRRRYVENEPSANAGVCRDSASTLAAFFHECGIPGASITIDSYLSTSGGHQIVSVRSPEGKLYTVNWSELTSQNPEKSIDPILARPHSLYDQGIQQLRYNWRGEVIGRRDTSLGSLLKQSTRGILDDPFYNPSLMSLEAQAAGLRITAFQGSLADRHRVQGATLSYQRSLGRFMGIEAATAQAQRTDSAGFRSNITYGRYLFFVRPTLELESGWALSPIVQFEGAGALFRASGEPIAPDGHLRLTPGISASKRFSGTAHAYLECTQGLGIDPYNNNQADVLRPTLFRERFLVMGGVVLSNQWDLSLQRRADIWNRSTTLVIQKGDRLQRWNIQGAFSIYEIPGQPALPLITTGLSRSLDQKNSRIHLRGQYQQAVGGRPVFSITLLRTSRSAPRVPPYRN